MALFDQISSRNSERGGEAFLPKSQKIPKWSKINAQEWVRLAAFAFPPPPVIERDDRGGGESWAIMGEKQMHRKKSEKVHLCGPDQLSKEPEKIIWASLLTPIS